MIAKLRTRPAKPATAALSPRTDLATERAADRIMLEFSSPTAAVIGERLPIAGRATIWIISATILSSIALLGIVPVDRVVAVPGKVVSKVANLVVQPLDTSIVRRINVREGQVVHAGDPLIQLDSTFAAADAGAVEAQVASLTAEVERLEAEAGGKAYAGDGTKPAQLQAMIFTQRRAEHASKLENYRRRIESAQAKVAQTNSDIASYSEQFKVARAKEGMRQELERLQVGTRFNTLDAGAQRAEINRALQAALAGNQAATSDQQALVAERDSYIEQHKAEISQQLSEQGRKLADAREQLAKAQLRHKLVDLRSDRDAVVLNVAKLSVGSVVQSGDELITLVPTDAPLAVEANVPARDAGFIQPGNPVIIKFDALPYTTYGNAKGTLTTVSADSFTNASGARERPSRPNAAAGDAGGATFFRANVSLDELKLHNLPSGFRMTPGMPVVTDIKVGRHTILSYLVGKIAPALTEGMREP